MPAYELFAATTTDLFIANIRAKAEAYGWTIDFFGIYLSHNRLHLHNANGSHFEIWYSSAVAVNIRGCTGYSSSDTPLAQPGTSATVVWNMANYWHLIVIGVNSINIKSSTNTNFASIQIGTIVDKIGAWSGGHCISSGTYMLDMWQPYSAGASQVYINGGWSTLVTTNAGGVSGTMESGLSSKMPFAYSGGILPIPMLLVQRNLTTVANLHPIGYAPDFRGFNGGDVYESLTPITIDGESWLPFNRLELISATPQSQPNTLIRLAT